MYDRYMTTSENPKPIPFDPLLASIFTQMSKDAAWTQNQLDKSQQEDIREWKNRFLKLFLEIEDANERVDSARIDGILMRFGHAADTAARDLDSH